MTLSVEIMLDDEHLQTMFGQIIAVMPSSISGGVEEGARRVNAAIRELEPHGSGELQAVTGEYDPSYLETGAKADPDDAVFWVGQSKAGEYTAIVGTNLPYAKFVNDGFTAGPNQFARFWEGGQQVFRRLEPGKVYPGMYFFERGAEEAQADVQRILQSRVNMGLMEAATSVTIDSRGRAQVRGKGGRYLGTTAAARGKR